MKNLKEKVNNYFSGLVFDEPKHKYTWRGDSVKMSTSKVVSKFYEFDAKAVAKSIEDRTGKPAEKSLAEWKITGDAACELGTETHLFAEKHAMDRSLEPKNGLQRAAVAFWKDLDPSLEIFALELQMFHLGHKFAGTADIVLYDKKANTFMILDYKTNKDLFKNYQGKKMLYPFTNWLDTPFNHYQLQLSTYQMMLEQVSGVKVTSNIIVWLKPNGGYELYPVGSDELTKWFDNYLETNLHL